jgi:hypothetical protein
MTATIDEAAKTLGEFEALAQQTGEWDGADAVEFSDDGHVWSPIWMAGVARIEGADGTLIRETVTDPHPAFARARVYRKGVAHTDWQYVSWDESVPADDEWRALWMRKPVKLFGSFALRSAYRHAFRDVVGDRRGPDEQTDGPTVGPAPTEARDWAAEYRQASTAEQVDQIRRDCRAARQNTLELQDLWSARRAELAASEWEPAEGDPGAATALTNEEYERTATGTVRRTEARPGAPRDFLAPAGNRATRRAKARKKGGKR